MKTTKYEHILNQPIVDVFEFFCNEKNLEKITPPWLNFKVINKSTSQIQKGTLIDYKLKIKKIPTHWRTLISEWNPPHSFVDEQLKGPYSYWHHRHEFSALSDQSTLMKDTITYKIPFGFLGDFLLGSVIQKDIETIFQYRKNIIDSIFI